MKQSWKNQPLHTIHLPTDLKPDKPEQNTTCIQKTLIKHRLLDAKCHFRKRANFPSKKNRQMFLGTVCDDACLDNGDCAWMLYTPKKESTTETQEIHAKLPRETESLPLCTVGYLLRKPLLSIWKKEGRKPYTETFSFFTASFITHQAPEN